MDRDSELPIRKVLEPGEQLLWAGRPRQGILPVDITIVLVILPFLLAPIFFAFLAREIRDPRNEYEGIGADLGLAFVVLLAVLFFVTAVKHLVFVVPDRVRLRSRFLYGLTDRRAIVIAPEVERRFPRSSGRERTVASVPLEMMSSVAVTSRLGGTGTVSVESSAGDWPRPPAWESSSRKSSARRLFDYIDSADAVGRLLNDAGSASGRKAHS
jgi:hypothetical protein